MGKRAKSWMQLFILVVAILLFRAFLWQSYRVPSSSMVPTLLVGDQIFGEKFVYGYSRWALPFGFIPFHGRIAGRLPKRGDIIVFRLPSKPSVSFVKRVIGLPGDRIQVVEGRLYINGKQVPRHYVGTYNYRDYDSGENVPYAPLYLETLPGGVTHKIIELDGDRGYADNTPVYTVPEDSFFAMGDNRDRSEDSRFPAVGFVPLDNAMAPVRYVWLSVDYGGPKWWKAWAWTIRYGHMGSAH